MGKISEGKKHKKKFLKPKNKKAEQRTNQCNKFLNQGCKRKHAVPQAAIRRSCGNSALKR